MAASGGPSSVYSKPSWQSGITGMPADSKRDTPDISLFASNGQNNSFYIICQKDFTGSNSCDLNSPFMDFEGVGGTSASVQAFAGIMALINQSQATVQDPAPRRATPTTSSTSCTNSTLRAYALPIRPPPALRVAFITTWSTEMFLSLVRAGHKLQQYQHGRQSIRRAQQRGHPGMDYHRGI